MKQIFFPLNRFLFLLSLLFLMACSSVKTAESAGDNFVRNISFKTMLDGRVWTVQNLNITTANSYCQENDPIQCSSYGRLYSWEAAKNACSLLGAGWRLPTLGEWQLLIENYGGIYGESVDNGKSAYISLVEGGTSGFEALLGGNREVNGNFERLGAHGFYWTATEADSSQALFINFAKRATLINKHRGEKTQAVSVRCIKN